MSKILGVFDLFDNLDRFSDQELLAEISTKIDSHNLINYLGNRIIYSQTVAMNKMELEIDSAILALAIRKKPEKIYRHEENRIVIPYLLIPRFPPLPHLVRIIIDALDLEFITQVWIQQSGNFEMVGSIIPKKVISKIGKKDLENLMIKEELKKLTLGEINLLPVQDKQIRIKFSGGHEFDCFGGNLGILIDLRNIEKK